MQSPSDAERFSQVQASLSSTRYVFTAYSLAHNETLTTYLARQLDSDPATVQEFISAGKVYVNGKPATSERLPLPCRIECFLPKVERRVPFDEENIIFEDEFIIAVNKPAGISTLPTRDGAADSLKSRLTALRPSLSLHFPSRLDTAACGVVVVSGCESTHDTLQRVFSKHTAQKHYIFGTDACTFEGVVDQPIGRDTLHSILRKITVNGQKAVTRFSLIERRSDRTLMLAQPITGRTHQIRVHAAWAGMPLRGDPLYGHGGEALKLCATRQHFVIGGREYDIRLPQELYPAWAGLKH